MTNRRPSLSLLRQARIAGLSLVVACVAGVGSLSGFSDPLCTGKIMTSAQVQALFPTKTYVGNDTYAVVDSRSLSVLQQQFVATVYRNGLKPEWSPRFACGKFSLVFVATARLAYLSHHGNEPDLPGLAVGEVWFMTGPHSAHAIVVAVTERGVVYWDPQCGQEVQLDRARLEGTILRKF